ncbi:MULTISPECIES: hypothetical protein [unclassified Clostridium]|jgi:hypothetical protein
MHKQRRYLEIVLVAVVVRFVEKPNDVTDKESLGEEILEMDA